MPRAPAHGRHDLLPRAVPPRRKQEAGQGSREPKRRGGLQVVGLPRNRRERPGGELDSPPEGGLRRILGRCQGTHLPARHGRQRRRFLWLERPHVRGRAGKGERGGAHLGRPDVDINAQGGMVMS